MTPETIEAVARAAYEAYSETSMYAECEPRWEDFHSSHRQRWVTAIRAAIAAMPSGVRVKPLVWRDSYSVIRADTEFGNYQTSASGKILTLGVAPMSPQTVCANLDDAKAAAQADYERRILSALEPAPAREVTVAENSIDHQQRQGRDRDIIIEAINTYDDYMLDDDFEPQVVLDRIINRLKERAIAGETP